MIYGTSMFYRILSRVFLYTFVSLFIYSILSICLLIMEETYNRVMAQKVQELKSAAKALENAYETEASSASFFQSSM